MYVEPSECKSQGCQCGYTAFHPNTAAPCTHLFYRHESLTGNGLKLWNALMESMHTEAGYVHDLLGQRAYIPSYSYHSHRRYRLLSLLWLSRRQAHRPFEFTTSHLTDLDLSAGLFRCITDNTD
ncbi:hypothetical protein M422DRAFT_23194 [Sphaerobolus stellatus SS14]|nr:hypothetical protein M422DRAFT_23194 [Sphaerobolus stellatus SS14]